MLRRAVANDEEVLANLSIENATLRAALEMSKDSPEMHGTATIIALLTRARRLGGLFSGLVELRRETFTGLGRVHRWQNHVPKELRELWSVLSDETKLAVYILAESGAGEEEWE